MPPIYEYECPNGHRSEYLARLCDASLPLKCHCGADAPRVMSPTRTTFVFADTTRRSRKGGRK